MEAAGEVKTYHQPKAVGDVAGRQLTSHQTTCWDCPPSQTRLQHESELHQTTNCWDCPPPKTRLQHESESELQGRCIQQAVASAQLKAAAIVQELLMRWRASQNVWHGCGSMRQGERGRETISIQGRSAVCEAFCSDPDPNLAAWTKRMDARNMTWRCSKPQAWRRLEQPLRTA
eukprot:365026-Chlamydomonas_euryale.AAC.12